MLVLDTDHLTELGYRTTVGQRLSKRLGRSHLPAVIPIVTVQERIGAMDLRIACIVMEYDAVLLTRNTKDFEKVPGLKFENRLE